MKVRFELQVHLINKDEVEISVYYGPKLQYKAGRMQFPRSEYEGFKKILGSGAVTATNNGVAFDLKEFF